ncbi:MAG: site-specific tyrosine recombinase XerC [Deltaproteobacteria bacterium]|nr:site-specific tyrosine recombinase XerC [Deltaproteobacteria bacterium]
MRKKRIELKDDGDPRGMATLILQHLEDARVSQYSEHTVTTKSAHLRSFAEWCEAREVRRPVDVSRQLCERYQRHLFHYRKENGQPLTYACQQGRLAALRGFFKWATKKNHVLFNPASELEMHSAPRRIPRAILSASEVDQVMILPDLAKPTGLRDRAILETFYSTGIRRSELAHLWPRDVDVERGTLLVREGKGRRDRMLPIGERACRFISKYLDEARPFLAVDDTAELFVHDEGGPFVDAQLTQLIGRYIRKANLGKIGSCHMLRHTMATLMLEGGADVRFIQAMLGHAKLSTTEIYTHVSILKLQAVHKASHPSSTMERKHSVALELIDAVDDAEALEEAALLDDA